MSKRYILGNCVVVLLASSCWLLAQPGTQRGNQEELNAVVKNHLEALQAGRYAEVVKLREFHNDKEREEFQEDLERRGALMKWDLNQDIHLVRALQKKDHVQALYLLPTKQGYLPERFSVRDVKGQLKLVHENRRESGDRDFDVLSAKLVELRQSLDGWKDARGVILAEKTSVLKEQLQEEIDALDYAEKKKLDIVPGYGDLEKRRAVYDAVRNLSDEELRSKMMEEIQSAIEALSL